MGPPTAYVTSASEKAAICITRPILRLASSIRLVISDQGLETAKCTRNQVGSYLEIA